MQSYDFKLVGKSGKDIPAADSLSRFPVKDIYPLLRLQETREYNICSAEVSTMAAFSDAKKQELLDAANADSVYQESIEVIITGWPLLRTSVENSVKPFWNFREELVVYDGLVFG